MPVGSSIAWSTESGLRILQPLDRTGGIWCVGMLQIVPPPPIFRSSAVPVNRAGGIGRGVFFRPSSVSISQNFPSKRSKIENIYAPSKFLDLPPYLHRMQQTKISPCLCPKLLNSQSIQDSDKLTYFVFCVTHDL